MRLSVHFIALALVLFLTQHIRSQSSSYHQRKAAYNPYELQDLLDKRQYGSALGLINQLLEENPSGTEKANLYYQKAFCALQIEHPDFALYYQQFLQQYPEHPHASKAHFDMGSYHYQKKEYAQALQYFTKVSEKKLSKREKVDLHFKTGYAYFTQKNFEDALPHFNQVKASENQYTMASLYYAGYCSFKLKKYSEALVDLQKAEQNPDYKDLVPHLVATVYYQQSNYQQVIDYVPAKLDAPGVVGKPEMLQALADSYYQKKDYTNASKYFTELQKSGSLLSRELKYRIGFCQFKNKQFDECIQVLKEVAGQEDTLGQSGSFYLGIAYLNKKEKNLALSSFDIARRSNFNPKTREEAFFLYSKLLADLGDYHRSLESLQKYTQEYPGNNHQDEINDLLSICYGRTSKYDESIRWYESLKKKSVTVNRNFQRHTYFKAVENYNNEKYSEAKLMFDKSLSMPLDNDLVVASHFWNGEIFSIQKEYTQAILSYQKALQAANPENQYVAKCHYGLGYGFFNNKEYERSYQEFKNFVKVANVNKNATAYNDALLRLGDLSFERRKYIEALSYYDQAIERKSRDADYALYQKGVIHLRENQLQEAKTCYSTILSQYPHSLLKEGSIFSMAEIDFLQSNLDQAVAGFSQLIGTKLNNQPFEPEALLKRALVYGQQNKNEEAISDFLTILEKYYNLPVHEDALRGAQDLYAKLERTEEFEKKLEEFRTKNPNSQVFQDVDFESARNLFFSEKYSKSLTAFQQYMKKYPESSNALEARYYLAESYYQTNNKEKARQEFELVVKEKNNSNMGKTIMRLAEISQAKSDWKEANKYYRLLIQNAKNKREKNIAYSGLMNNSYQLQQLDSASIYAKELLSFNPPNTSYSNKAHMMIARCAYAKGDFETSEDHWLEIVNNDKEELAAEAQYLIAESLYKQKKYKPSTEACYQLNNQYAQYEFWLGKSYLLIAENLIAQQELVHAKATLKSVIENTADPQIKQMATARLNELNAQKINE
ncbi:MAG: tetratricopeptide repeat protein [Cytophagaceae bacterium]|jgi:tetratricopeptide (TPR) repeat protein|nr:tetratricopeptide repeat protein [Cytophagaceae bacterium]